MAVTEEAVLAALTSVVDPDKQRDVVALGMVQGLAIREGHVGFTLEVARERGPRLEPLRQAAERAVEAIPGVLSVTAVLTAQAAPKPQPQAHGHAHGHGQPNKILAPGVKSIIAV